MGKLIKILGVSVAAIVMAASVQAQIIQFSQTYATPTFLGPSFAGLTQMGRVTLNYRNQWPNISSPSEYQTYAFSADVYLHKIGSGLGISLLRDVAGPGDLGSTIGAIQYTKSIRMGNLYVRPGAEFNYTQRSFNPANVTWIDQVRIEGENWTESDIPQTFTANKRQYLDATASGLLYNEKFWIGLTADNLLRPNQTLLSTIDNEAYIDRKFMFYGGYKIRTSTKKRRTKNPEDVTITFLYQMQGSSDQLNIGAYYNRYPLVAGVWLRGIPIVETTNIKGSATDNFDAVIWLIGYKMGSVSLGYSYDMSINDLIGKSGGASELSLIYSFDPNIKGNKKKRKGMIPCPGF